MKKLCEYSSVVEDEVFVAVVSRYWESQKMRKMSKYATNRANSKQE